MVTIKIYSRKSGNLYRKQVKDRKEAEKILKEAGFKEVYGVWDSPEWIAAIKDDDHDTA